MEHVKSIFGLGFTWSNHKRIYRHIGRTYDVSARVVYRLAHGLRPHNNKEVSIVYELLGAGVMVG